MQYHATATAVDRDTGEWRRVTFTTDTSEHALRLSRDFARRVTGQHDPREKWGSNSTARSFRYFARPNR